MNKLNRFKPVLGMCSQGQKKTGVNEGGLYLYKHIFRDLCDSKPFVVQHEQFDSAAGYLKLYQTCHSLHKPLLLGGDHSVSSSSVLASLQKYKDLNVIWVDAHPDIHTYDSTESGNTHGTPLSICTGMEQQHWASRMNLRKLRFDKLTYCGIRDIDPFEAETIAANNIRVLDVPNLIDYIKKLDGPIHISFDVDGLDPELVDSTGTKVPNGLEPEEVREIIATALEMNKLVSLDVVEFNIELGNPENSLLAVKRVFETEELTSSDGEATK
jgi:arginase